MSISRYIHRHGRRLFKSHDILMGEKPVKTQFDDCTRMCSCYITAEACKTVNTIIQTIMANTDKSVLTKEIFDAKTASFSNLIA